MTEEILKQLNSIDTDSILADIEAEQKEYFLTYKTYLQFLPYLEGEILVNVFEYSTPKNELGYQVFFIKELNESKYIKSVGYGAKAEVRTSGWTEYFEDKI